MLSDTFYDRLCTRVSNTETFTCHTCNISLTRGCTIQRNVTDNNVILCIVGSIQTRSYTDKQGQKRYATEVVADEAYFVDSKSEADNRRPASQNKPENSSFQYVPEQYQTQPAPNMRELSDDEDSLPF